MNVLTETLELVRSSASYCEVGSRFEGLSRLAREFDRLGATKPDELVAAIAVLELTIDHWQFEDTYDNGIVDHGPAKEW